LPIKTFDDTGEEEHAKDRIKERRSVALEGTGLRLNVSITAPRQVQRADLIEKYEIQKFDLSRGFECPEKFRALIPKGTPEFYNSSDNYVEMIMRALHHFKQCALIGPTGTGKTHVVYLIAEMTGLPLWEINCGLQTSSYDLFGRYIGLGRENWIDGQILSWCRNGGILYLDEANMMRQDVATRLNPVLDARGHIVLTERDSEIVPRHEYGFVVMSINPFSPEFAGTKPLNNAFRRRMSVWIDFDYLSVGNKISQQEVELVAKRGRVSRQIATAIVRIGAELRRQYKASELPYGPSVGDLANWALLVADGVPPVRAAEQTIVAMTSENPEVRDTVRRLVRLIFSDSSYSVDTAGSPKDLS
jgi:nitric oxide reductase NorQ protein